MALSDYIGSSDEEGEIDYGMDSYILQSESDGPHSPVDPYADIQRIESFESPCQFQEASPLFNILPTEIRELVYTHVFTEYEDLSQPYDFETCYRRPGYMAPRKTDTSLLRACQAIYNEAWFLPWTLAQHTFYLAWNERKPDKTTEMSQMTQICAMMQRLHADIPDRFKTIPHVQIFSQLCMIGTIHSILNIPHFMPRTITITIRHTDIWSWESDDPITVDRHWISHCQMPNSVGRVRIQIESLERKKEQVDHIVSRMRQEWYFSRQDDTHLVGMDTSVERWTGCSTWEKARWLRDEDENDPERLHYYVATVSFQAVAQADDIEGYELRQQLSFPRYERLRVPLEVANRTTLNVARPFLLTRQLQEAGIPSGTPASEAYRMYDQWTQRSV